MMDKVIKTGLFFYLLSLHSISFSQTTEQPLPLIRAGYYFDSFADLSIRDIESSLRFWTNETTKESGIRGETHVYSDLKDMRTDFYQRKLDFIAASPLVFVMHFNLDLLADGYILASYGKTLDKLIVVTHKQTQSNHFNKLRNQRLALLRNDSVSKMFANTLALESFGIKAKQLFSTISYINKSNLLIYDLFFKKTDVIIVYQEAYNLAIEMNPQIARKTQIIAQLDDIPRGLSFFHQQVDPEFREHAISLAVKLTDSPRRKQLLALFRAEKLERSSLADLKSTQQLNQRYLRLIKKHRVKQ